MKRPRELIVTNMLALVVLLVVLLLGWREAAAFGLAVLVILDLLAVLRERGARSDDEKRDDDA
jgi:type IV secretory pathway TrbD component